MLVTSRRHLKQFVELPYTHYVGNQQWVPPLRRDEYRRLTPVHNPFLRHADLALWIAESDGRAIGRIAAIDDRLHNEKHHEHAVFFGFFEADSEATTRQLVAAVDEWARKRGATVLRGPANPSLNESAGLLVDAFDLPPSILMPYNPPEYARFLEACGFSKSKDLFAWTMDLSLPLGARIVRVATRLRKRHDLVVRPVDLAQFDRDLAHLQTIYREAWQDNWGFVAPTDEEIKQLAADLKPIIDPEMAIFAELNGRPVGCAIAIPDMNQVLKRMNGRLLPFGIWHFLRRASIVDRVRVILAGVLPEMRQIGLWPLLIADLFERGVRRGYRSGELSWTLEDNDDVNAGIQAAGGVHQKTYRLYERPVTTVTRTSANQ